MSTFDVELKLRELQQRPNKDLGQNFLINKAVVGQIVTAGFAALPGASVGGGKVDPRRRVLEIGPGLGVLTKGILEQLPAGGQLVAVEKDHHLAMDLPKTIHNRNLKVIHSDVTVFDRGFNFTDGEFIVLANLPFNISTFIVNSLLTQNPRPARVVLMLQQEVAERILAPAGHSSRGLLSVIAEYYAQGRVICQVPRADFYPVPKVDATVIVLDLVRPISSTDQSFFKLVKQGFSQRRKTLANSLSGLMPGGKQAAAALLTANNINPQARAQELNLEQWLELYRAVTAR